jgi:hypothetical protein
MKVAGLPAWIGPSARIQKGSILCRIMYNGLPMAKIGVISLRYPYKTYQICVIVCYKLIRTFTNVNRSLCPHPFLSEEIVKMLCKLCKLRNAAITRVVSVIVAPESRQRAPFSANSSTGERSKRNAWQACTNRGWRICHNDRYATMFFITDAGK